MKKEELILIYGNDIEEMTRQILIEADLASMIPSKEARIGIKPNMVSPSPPEDGAVTHPEIVGAIIAYLQENGFYHIIVMEGSWVGDRTQDAYDIIGYGPVLDRYQVPFADMQKEKGVPVDCAGLTLQVCKAAMDVDFLINVPVLKGHCQTRITCALKNMKGLLPNSEKRRFHKLGLHDPIGHLSAGIHQDFILVDSICGDLTFEDGGHPTFQGRLIAAADPVLCDTLGCLLLGIDPADVPYIGIAQKAGGGSDALCDAAVRVIRKGQSEDGGKADGWRITSQEVSSLCVAQSGYRHVCDLAANVCEVESCSACYGSLIPALERLEQEGLLEKLTDQICIGQGYRGKSGYLGIGNCTNGFIHTLQGCPPDEDDMYEYLKNYIVAE